MEYLLLIGLSITLIESNVASKQTKTYQTKSVSSGQHSHSIVKELPFSFAMYTLCSIGLHKLYLMFTTSFRIIFITLKHIPIPKIILANVWMLNKNTIVGQAVLYNKCSLYYYFF